MLHEDFSNSDFIVLFRKTVGNKLHEMGHFINELNQPSSCATAKLQLGQAKKCTAAINLRDRSVDNYLEQGG
ncbi:hypothetical protein LSTR_LSTR005288 [Laodelphax striatellus]|uniref:Uncharacterized protein n=1 Tax=Laodelphax striatellus TaxID=195883 RepID=A0A482X812_LAOST|nr:hypothetical protein LSTR_LSTR005288 [Laodelphax striatellus]